jgi:hypothetical protein
MVQAFSRRPLTAEARISAQVSPCGQSGTGIGFLRVVWFRPATQRSTVAPYSSITAPRHEQAAHYHTLGLHL